MRYYEILEMALNRKVLAGDWENDDINTGFLVLIENYN
jgi:hypothetical protein